MDPGPQTVRERRSRRAAAATLAASALLAGCGPFGSSNAERRKPRVREVVREFAAADDERACRLLTPGAIRRLYETRAKCVARSGRFEGEPIEIEQIQVERQRAKVYGSRLEGRRDFTVFLKKRGRRWYIDDVAEKRAPRE